MLVIMRCDIELEPTGFISKEKMIVSGKEKHLTYYQNNLTPVHTVAMFDFKF